MRHFTVSILIITFSVHMFTSNASAAVHYFGDSYSVTDTWYKIEPKKQYLDIYYSSEDTSPANSETGIEYYQNEQTFLDFRSSGNNKTYFAGSYLLKNGFFIGGLYQEDTLSSLVKVSPGYRFTFNESSYLAMSLEYSSTITPISNESDINSFELEYKYFGKKTQLSTQIYSPATGDPYINFNTNFQVLDELVIGVNCISAGGNIFLSEGFTWSNRLFIGDVKNDNYPSNLSIAYHRNL